MWGPRGILGSSSKLAHLTSEVIQLLFVTTDISTDRKKVCRIGPGVCHRRLVLSVGGVRVHANTAQARWATCSHTQIRDDTHLKYTLSIRRNVVAAEPHSSVWLHGGQPLGEERKDPKLHSAVHRRKSFIACFSIVTEKPRTSQHGQ